MARRPVLVMAGGTGGHVFPGLAVAQALAGRGESVEWLGTRRGIEARVVPDAGIPVHWINIGGLRGKGPLTRLVAPFRLAWALTQALAVMLTLRPRVVLGMGGFVTGPGGIAAWLTRRPLVIHEQNAVAGMTNRLLARFARCVLEAFPGSFPDDVVARSVGNPVRPEIAALAPPTERLYARQGAPRLLVVGGSLGALTLNRLVPAALSRLPAEARPEVWHQAGERTLDVAESAYSEARVEARVTPFIDAMDEAYAWADLVVCRAGALTISELAAAGVPALLVPLPSAVDDHQTRNAGFLVNAGAAVLFPERDTDAGALASALGSLLSDRERLVDMAMRARAAARPESLESIAETCLGAALPGGEA